MTVSVDIEVARRGAALTAVVEGIRDEAGAGPWALVVRDGRLVRQAVKLGARGERWVEIAEGLSEGDLIVPATTKGVVVGQRARARVKLDDGI